MFFSLLYILILGAFTTITIVSIRAIIKGKPIKKWIVVLLTITIVYLILIALSIWF